MKKIMKNVLIFGLYFVYEYLFILLLSKNGIDFYSFSYNTKVLIILGLNIFFILFLFFMYKDELKRDFKDFKINYNRYISNYLSIYIIGVLLMGITNLLLQKITHLELSGNEESVRLLIQKIPLYMTFSSVIYAPFVEEMIFRKSIKNVINKKWIFILVSGLIFGAVHISDYNSVSQILMGIPYIIMGIDFAYIYYKTDNVFTTMSFHLCHNLLLLIVQLI